MNIGIRILIVAALIAVCAITPARADSYLPQIGGKGGAPYSERCPQGQILNGFEVRAGDDIDAIRAVCVTSSSPTDVGTPPLSNGFGGGWHGGGGGGLRRLLCPPGTPVVMGLVAGYDGIDTISLDTIDIYCAQASAGASIGQYPSNIIHAPIQGCTHGPNLVHPVWNAVKIAAFGDGRCPHFKLGLNKCPTGEIAIGMHGHSGALVDAMGLICGPAPTFAPPKPVVPAMGHTESETSLQRALRRAKVSRAPSAAVQATPARATAIDTKPTVTRHAEGLQVSQPAATHMSRKAIIIIGGKPEQKTRQPSVRDRVKDYQDQHDH